MTQALWLALAPLGLLACGGGDVGADDSTSVSPAVGGSGGSGAGGPGAGGAGGVAPGVASRAVKVAAGGGHTCALLEDGTVRCWGANRVGQLGDGAPGKYRPTPAPVPGLTGIIDLVASGQTCALRQDGAVFCWGSNNYLEASPLDERWLIPAPVRVDGLPPARGLAVASGLSCAVLEGGRARCWGIPAEAPSAPPINFVGDLDDAVQISVGELGSACAALGDGTVACWGDNADGQVGDGTTMHKSGATPVAGLSDVVEVACSDVLSCARGSGGSVHCWGRDESGVLGSSEPVSSLTPTLVEAITDATALSIRRETACVIRPGGAVQCWGSNLLGLLTGGTPDPEPHPTPITMPIEGVRQLSLADGHACAVKDDGSVWCWGENGAGQLGDGTVRLRPVPTRVALDGCGPDAPGAPPCGQGDPPPDCTVTFSDPSLALLDASPMLFPRPGVSACCDGAGCEFFTLATGDDGRLLGADLPLPLPEQPYPLASQGASARLRFTTSYDASGNQSASPSWVSGGGEMRVTQAGDTLHLEASGVPMVPISPPEATPGVGTFSLSVSCDVRMNHTDWCDPPF